MSQTALWIGFFLVTIISDEPMATAAMAIKISHLNPIAIIASVMTFLPLSW